VKIGCAEPEVDDRLHARLVPREPGQSESTRDSRKRGSNDVEHVME